MPLQHWLSHNIKISGYSSEMFQCVCTLSQTNWVARRKKERYNQQQSWDSNPVNGFSIVFLYSWLYHTGHNSSGRWADQYIKVLSRRPGNFKQYRAYTQLVFPKHCKMRKICHLLQKYAFSCFVGFWHDIENIVAFRVK